MPSMAPLGQQTCGQLEGRFAIGGKGTPRSTTKRRRWSATVGGALGSGSTTARCDAGADGAAGGCAAYGGAGANCGGAKRGTMSTRLRSGPNA